ncbi:protoporphyrinogen oxidase HemJ [Yoonia sp.]|jgi:putative membrane protein|uniref:protoporphyrinogen oxidase HemJ n=1 Tax=Yoonia sp. TaxID=2212373 RepID=UPI0025EC0400|nr:protoporphyrinogen oxidase HemJ [Yoonia sp.]
MTELFNDIYPWIKAVHIMAVIAWMAGLFYLPRLFVYHVERAAVGSEMDQTFQIMEAKLLRVIMNPAMIVAWIAGLIMIALGAFDWGSAWAWVKIVSAVLMTAAHVWMGARRKEFAVGANTRSGRSYRLFNEVPTVLMLLIVIAVVVRPF